MEKMLSQASAQRINFQIKVSTIHKLLKVMLYSLLLYFIVVIFNTIIVTSIIAFYPAVGINEIYSTYLLCFLAGLTFCIIKNRKKFHLKPNSIKEMKPDQLVKVILAALIVLPCGLLAAVLLIFETGVLNDIEYFFTETLLGPFENHLSNIPAIGTLENPFFYFSRLFVNDFIIYDMLVIYCSYWLVKKFFCKDIK